MAFAREVFFPLGGILIEPDRWIAVGTRRASDAEGGGFLPGAWTSADDGRSWTATQIGTDAPGTLPGYIRDTATIGSDLVAIGHIEDPAADGRSTAAVWRSTDGGQTWTRLPDDPSFRGTLMTGILALDENRFVVFGAANDPNALANPNLIWLAARQP